MSKHSRIDSDTVGAALLALEKERAEIKRKIEKIQNALRCSPSALKLVTSRQARRKKRPAALD